MTEINGKPRTSLVQDELQARLVDVGARLGTVADEFVVVSRIVNKRPSNVSWMSNSKHVIIVAPVVLKEEILRRIASGDAPEVTFKAESSGGASSDS